MDASRYRLNQADLNLENTREEVRYQAAEAYANLLHQENLTKIAGEAVDMAKTQLRLISDQYSEGAVAKADVLMMEVQLANCRKNLVSAKSATEVARSTLASIVGLPQDTMSRIRRNSPNARNMLWPTDQTDWLPNMPRRPPRRRRTKPKPATVPV